MPLPAGSSESQRNKRLAFLSHTLGFTWAILISVGGRLCNALLVPVTLGFITHALTPEQQGFYYTFSSVFALQSFLELGFLSCISHVASHHNRADVADPGGNHHEIRLLIGYGFLYAVGIALLAFIFVGGIGWFFIRSGKTDVAFAFFPWCAFVSVSCLNICISPVMAILDGCNKVLFTSTMRMIGMLANGIGLCIALYQGFGLYSLAIGIGASVLITSLGLLFKFTHLLTGWWREVGAAVTRWHRVILPFQGKIAVSTVCSYLLGTLFTPILYRFSSAEAAGRFGMSLQLLNSIGAIALVWTTTKTGIYGSLAQQKDYVVLERLFTRTTLQSAIFAFLGVLGLLLAYWVASDRFAFFSRMLPWHEVAVLGWPVIVIQFTVAFSSLSRAFGQERLLVAGIFHTIIHVTLLLVLIPAFAETGAVWTQVISYTFGWGCAVAIYRRFRREMLLNHHG